jgi:hypothetical protein
MNTFDIGGDYDISDTGLVPRGLRVFSLAIERPEIKIPVGSRFIAAMQIEGPAVQVAPDQGNWHGPAETDQAANIGHNSTRAAPMREEDEVEGDCKAERIAFLREQIAMVIGAQRQAAMAASDIGKLANLTRLKVLRTNLMLGAVRHCRRNPQADSRLAILGFITFLSDNKLGMCRLSVRRIGRILGRSDQAIVTSIASLEKDGQIGVLRRFGAGSILLAADPSPVGCCRPPSGVAHRCDRPL